MFGIILLWQVGEVSYHDFPGVKIDEEAKDSLINSFGPASQVRCFFKKTSVSLFTLLAASSVHSFAKAVFLTLQTPESDTTALCNTWKIILAAVNKHC